MGEHRGRMACVRVLSAGGVAFIGEGESINGGGPCMQATSYSRSSTVRARASRRTATPCEATPAAAAGEAARYGYLSALGFPA